MRVALLPGDQGGCGFHRMRIPGGIAKANGLDVQVLETVPGTKYPDGTMRINVQGIEADVVVIQRPLKPVVVESIERFQAEGVAVVVELDDDLRALPKNHRAYKVLDPSLSPDMNWEYLDEALEKCDFAIFSTNALALKYGKPGRCAVVPNYIPQEILDIEYKLPLHTVGWTSDVETHPNDLQTTQGGVAKAVESAEASLFVVGNPVGVRAALGCSDSTNLMSPGWVDFFDYYFFLRAIKVGIVPLEKSDFNQAKSNLKGLEFSALGIPFVASPTSEYSNLFSNGAGYLAFSAHDWESTVHSLLVDDIFRNEVGERSKETIKRFYLLENNWHKYAEAWEEAWKVKNREDKW